MKNAAHPGFVEKPCLAPRSWEQTADRQQLFHGSGIKGTGEVVGVHKIVSSIAYAIVKKIGACTVINGTGVGVRLGEGLKFRNSPSGAVAQQLLCSRKSGKTETGDKFIELAVDLEQLPDVCIIIPCGEGFVLLH